MNNQWIEHKGGECPVEAHTELELKFGDGITRGPVKAGQAAWSAGLPQKYSIVAYRKYNCPPDPHKEWVKIQEGCPMPDHGQLIVIYTEGNQCMGFMTNRTVEAVAIPFLEDGSIPFSEIDCWRYPHPDPEDA